MKRIYLCIDRDYHSIGPAFSTEAQAKIYARDNGGAAKWQIIATSLDGGQELGDM